MIETNWSRNSHRLNSDILRRGSRLQDESAVQGRSEGRWRVIAHHRGGRETRLALGGFREHDAFFGHEIRGPAGTGRGSVSMAGGQEGQGARKGNGVRGHRLPSPPCSVQNLLMYFGFFCRWERLLGKIHVLVCMNLKNKSNLFYFYLFFGFM